MAECDGYAWRVCIRMGTDRLVEITCPGFHGYIDSEDPRRCGCNFKLTLSNTFYWLVRYPILIFYTYHRSTRACYGFPQRFLNDQLLTLKLVLNLERGVLNPNPDSKVHGANMGHTWVLSAPDGPHVGPWTLLSGKLIRSERYSSLAKDVCQPVYQPFWSFSGRWPKMYFNIMIVTVLTHWKIQPSPPHWPMAARDCDTMNILRVRMLKL